MRARARIAADAWARLTVVDACETPCGQNGDGGVIKVKPAILTDLSKWNFGCKTSGACVKNLPTSWKATFGITTWSSSNRRTPAPVTAAPAPALSLDP